MINSGTFFWTEVTHEKRSHTFTNKKSHLHLHFYGLLGLSHFWGQHHFWGILILLSSLFWGCPHFVVVLIFGVVFTFLAIFFQGVSVLFGAVFIFGVFFIFSQKCFVAIPSSLATVCNVWRCCQFKVTIKIPRYAKNWIFYHSGPQDSRVSKNRMNYWLLDLYPLITEVWNSYQNRKRAT